LPAGTGEHGVNGQSTARARQRLPRVKDGRGADPDLLPRPGTQPRKRRTARLSGWASRPGQDASHVSA
jgi:hypothetical protein